MIIFDQLRLSDDGKKLYIDLHVNKDDDSKNVYLDSITVTSSDRVSETHPGSPTEDYLWKQTFSGNQKEAHIVLNASDFTKRWDTENPIFKEADMDKTLFFVYVTWKGVPGECTPCWKDAVTVGITFNEKLLYQRVMDFTKSLADTCNIPAGFIDFILLWNAFKAAVETDHYIAAIKFWKMLFDSGALSVEIKGCGCHG